MFPKVANATSAAELKVPIPNTFANTSRKRSRATEDSSSALDIFGADSAYLDDELKDTDLLAAGKRCIFLSLWI